MPRLNGHVPMWLRRAQAWVPGLAFLLRLVMYVVCEVRGLSIYAYAAAPWANRNLRAVCAWNLRAGVPAGPLRDALIPAYAPGCKRVLVSSDWYPTLVRPNVEVRCGGVGGGAGGGHEGTPTRPQLFPVPWTPPGSLWTLPPCCRDPLPHCTPPATPLPPPALPPVPAAAGARAMA